MKIYTRPRRLRAELLRPGDEIALTALGMIIIPDELTYTDADLSDRVRWLRVVEVTPQGSTVFVRTTSGQRVSLDEPHPVITRELIELDPWTYVTPATDEDGTSIQK